ncbi:hypothetical protein [Pseudomonas qingdaonensis]|uniref:hypothetical protein n=4 Tax=Pseudomonas TaxID=286 RepID=UPI00197E336B|nr:hypothetical protein [Pseudomonas qingdaonensis]
MAEAERRMAEAFAYYTDKDWQTTISAAGVKFDDSTLAHLGQALAPLGANYATTDKGDVPSISEPHKVYTASETLALLKNYEINHANFYDPKVNQEYLINDRFLQNWEQLAYYDRNLNYGKTDLLGGGIGVGQGIAAAVAESAKNIYGLGEGLVTDFSGTSSRITNGLIQKASNPYEVAQAFESAKQDAKVQAFVLRLQGQEQAALRVEMQWETEFALSFAVINKAGKLGQVAKALGERETAWKASSLVDNAGGKNGPPGKNPNSTSGITDAEAGMPYAHSVGGAKGFGPVEGTYSAIKPGPLADSIAETFSGGRYSVVTLEKDTVLYRAGTVDKPLGQFFSAEPPSGILQTRIDKAVLPEWPGGAKSPLDTTFEIKIPAGTKVYVGEVGSQGGLYVGGTQQIVVQKP